MTKLPKSVTEWLSKIGTKVARFHSPAKAAAVRENGKLGGRPAQEGKAMNNNGQPKGIAFLRGLPPRLARSRATAAALAGAGDLATFGANLESHSVTDLGSLVMRMQL